jgi:hypothetical protein
MPSIRVWSGLIVLVLVSLLGDRLCRFAVSGGDQERLLGLGGEAVGRLPETFGRWRMLASEPLTPDILAILRCRDHQNRVYANEETGERVSLILLVGMPGPMVAHTPETCYSSAAFDVVEPARPEEIRGTGDNADTFDRVLFRSRSVAAQLQRVYYAWHGPDGRWQAPKNPRFTLGGIPVLYKLQLAASGDADSADFAKGADPKNDPIRRFLDDLLPVLDPLVVIR